MMKYYVINKDTGQYLAAVELDGTSAVNTPHELISTPPNTHLDIWTGRDWYTPEPQPSAYHIFDYKEMRWVDGRTLETTQEQKWTEIKSQRDQLEFGGFEFDGNIYDSNQVSQGRILGAASTGVDQTWTLADNTTVNLTASQLQQLYVALQAHIAGVHERGRIARQLIFDAETKEQVESIQL